MKRMQDNAQCADEQWLVQWHCLQKCTGFGKEVDEGICLATLVEVSQLGAAGQAQVMDAQTPLSANRGVE